MTSADLLAALAGTDASAAHWAELVDRHGNRLWAVCRAAAGAGLADDAFQEGLIAIRHGAARFQPGTDPEASAVAWMVTVVHRRAINLVRSESRRSSHERSAMPIHLADQTSLASDDAVTAHLAMRALEQLPERHQLVIRLRLLGGLDAAQTASVLGCPAGQVRVRLHRALEILRARCLHAGAVMPSIAGLETCLHQAGSPPASLPASAQAIAITTFTAPGAVASGLSFGAIMTMSAIGCGIAATLVFTIMPSTSTPAAEPGVPLPVAAPPGPAPATPVASVPTPGWAAHTGTDAFGAWADLTVAGVTQRMRWIPAGTFMMGCPEVESQAAAQNRQLAYHDTDRGAARFIAPLHAVSLGTGYWLADSPVTQALWLAVMGRNPSAYPNGGDHPVEQVSWNDCADFFQRLNAHSGHPGATVPSEAQWEYACRAGTTTATYAGDLDCQGPFLSPTLAAIAWYAGNSAVDGSVAHACDPTDFALHVRAAPHPVKQKKPNAWGLYDMLGNVNAWCADWYGPADAAPASDPHGPSSGSQRLLRGGSWAGCPGDVRAATPSALDPARWGESLGVRICIPQPAAGASAGTEAPSPSTQSATVPQGF